MTNIASELSRSLAAAVAAASTGIVSIDGRRRIGSTGIVWSADGVIVTANHTLHANDGIEVDGAPAALVGRDPSTDLAVLRGEKKGLTPIEFTDAEGLQVGNLVLAAGRPGRSVRAALGIVSALGGEWRTPEGARVERFIEVDGSLPAGFSGGPLLDTEGRAIGMNTSRLIRGGGTIPAATLRRVVASILEHGSARRPQLGVGVYPVEDGLLVMSIKPGSAAAAAGLLVGDILTSVDGRALRRPIDLSEALRDAAVGSELALSITRGGESRELRVTI